MRFVILIDSFYRAISVAKIPSWMPWAHFRRWANESREIIQEAIRAPFEATRTSVVSLRFDHFIKSTLSVEEAHCVRFSCGARIIRRG